MSDLSSFFTSTPGSGIGGLTWSVVSADTTAVSSAGYMFDNSAATHTMTLPNSPAVGNTVGYKDLNGSFGSFPLTIVGNGSKIQGYTDSMVIDVPNGYGVLTYSGASQGWVLTSASVGYPMVGKPMMHVQDQKAYNVDGGIFANDTWTNRTLNTVIYNDIQGASLAGNDVLLPAGIYYVEGKSRFYVSAATAASSYLLGISINGSAPSVGSQGLAEYAGNTAGYPELTPSVGCMITLSQSGTINLRYYSGTGSSQSYGSGVSNSTGGVADTSLPSIYSDLKIWKLDSDRIYNPKVYQPINQPVTGAYTVGNIYGGELNYVSATQFSVNAFSCYSDDNTTALFINSTTQVTITSPVLNTIYNVFAVKFNTGVFGILYDTDINGANLGGTVVAKRWLGPIFTNASAQIYSGWIMKSDSITFIPNQMIQITSTLTSSFVSYSLSSILPGARVLEVFILLRHIIFT
jgi:hypothetical protein